MLVTKAKKTKFFSLDPRAMKNSSQREGNMKGLQFTITIIFEV